MASKRKAKELVVTGSTAITSNMRRITLQGHDLAGFPDDAQGYYFKLVFPSTEPEQPILRTYTVSQHRAEQLEIDVDFMLHTSPDGSANGIAASWAAGVRVGDSMSIFGPGGASYINTDADWYLLVADMTALPAMVANFKRLPIDAKGYVVVEIMANEDKQDLAMPEGMELIWVVNPNPGSDESPLYAAVKELEWLSGDVSIWAACEFKTMKKNRQYFREVKGVEKSKVYISSYWKKGLQEEEHKIAKKQDSA